MNDKRKNELLALLLTLLLCAVVVFVLVNSYLHSVPLDEANTELKQDTIMFGGEYVMLGDMPDATEGEDLSGENAAEEVQETEQAEVNGDDLKDAGEPVKEPAPVVTTPKESPMKVKEKPKEDPNKKTGPAVDKKKDEKKEQVKQATNPTNDATNSRVKNAFGSGGGSGSGKQGSPNGNSDQGPTLGKPGLGGLQGYTLENWAKPNPNSKWNGTISVRVRVNTRGRVVEAHAVSGSGEAYSHSEIRRSCEQAALKSSFSVPVNTTTEGVGTVTYIWK